MLNIPTVKNNLYCEKISRKGAIAIQKYNPLYPLRGILFCKHGHRMTAGSPKGRNGHYSKYCRQKCRGKDAANYDVDTTHIKFYEYIENITLDQDIKEPEVRSRFQKWLFPVGLTYDGEKFGTAQMPLIYRLKKNTLSGILNRTSNLVVPTGLEPVTRGSSGRCSTN